MGGKFHKDQRYEIGKTQQHRSYLLSEITRLAFALTRNWEKTNKTNTKRRHLPNWYFRLGGRIVMITMRNCLVVSFLPWVLCWKSVLVQAGLGYSSLQSWQPWLMTNYHWRIQEWLHRVPWSAMSLSKEVSRFKFKHLALEVMLIVLCKADENLFWVKCWLWCKKRLSWKVLSIVMDSSGRRRMEQRCWHEHSFWA